MILQINNRSASDDDLRQLDQTMDRLSSPRPRELEQRPLSRPTDRSASFSRSTDHQDIINHRHQDAPSYRTKSALAPTARFFDVIAPKRTAQPPALLKSTAPALLSEGEEPALLTTQAGMGAKEVESVQQRWDSTTADPESQSAAGQSLSKSMVHPVVSDQPSLPVTDEPPVISVFDTTNYHTALRPKNRSSGKLLWFGLLFLTLLAAGLGLSYWLLIA